MKLGRVSEFLWRSGWTSLSPALSLVVGFGLLVGFSNSSRASEVNLISDILTVRDALIEQQDRFHASVGSDKLKDLVSKGQIEVRIPDKGHGNLTLIDGKIIPRVVHESSGVAFLFVERGMIDEDSAHLNRYIAKQHLIAGDDRQGRDVVVVWLEDSDQPTDSLEYLTDAKPQPKLDVREFNRYKKYSLAWFKDYFTAIYQRPKLNDVVFGASCGLIQATMACGVSLAKMAIVGGQFQPEPAMLSALFGTVIGSYISTYKEWTTMGSQNIQTAKSATVSLLFSYSLVALTQDGFHSLNFFDPHGALNHINIALNAYANNLAKVGWGQLPIVRDELRLNSGTKSYRDLLKWAGDRVGDPKLGEIKTDLKLVDEILDLQFKRSAIENQANYLIPFTLKLGDLIQVSVPLPMGMSLPLGKAALWASIPLSRYLALKYVKSLDAKTILDGQHLEDLDGAQRQHLEEILAEKIAKLQDRYQRMWDATKRNILTAPQRLVGFVGGKCRDLLSTRK